MKKDDDEKENAEDEQEVAVFEEVLASFIFIRSFIFLLSSRLFLCLINKSIKKQNYGLRIQDLQEEKDKLLVETADMLRCSIFTAEILLKKHGI